MENLQVVGHRGARGKVVENTKSSLIEAQRLGVDAVEFDVRLTADKKLVLCHNRNLKKIYGVDKNVDDLELAELKKLKSPNGETIPALQEVLDLGIKVPLLLDVKNRGSADLIYQLMNRPENQGVKWGVSSFHHDEAARFKELDSSLWVAVGTIRQPFGIIRIAKDVGADGVVMNLLLLDFFNYRGLRGSGFQVMAYMNYVPFLLNTPWIVRALRKFYPGIIICTDRPDKIVPVIKG